jgi:LemA protein
MIATTTTTNTMTAMTATEERSMRKLAVAGVLLLSLLLSGCGYNTLQREDEQIKSAWSEVLNQYQRRFDLIPNLVNTVKGFAEQEKEVLLGVANARASVGAIRATPELVNDPKAFEQFIAAQNQLQGALARLLVVAEQYPQLKSDALFRDLTAQLEGTENRIAVARNRYIKTVQDYNTTVRSFPTNLTAMIFKMDVKPNFAVADEAAVRTPPKVDFGTPPPAPAPAPAKS